MSEASFADLPLAEPIQRVLRENDYKRPSPIQAQAIPPILEGRDIIGCAQTGTGKTAAFALPLLQMLSQPYRLSRYEVRALILVPTRELAIQVDRSFETYGKHLKIHRALVFGGVSPAPQIKALRRGVDVVVATPGRLLDLYQQQHFDLDKTKFLVLDEVDQMLDMGFLPDVRRICAELPNRRQSLFFSATLAPAMKELASTIVHKPVMVRIDPEKPTVERIQQQICFVAKKAKNALLEHIVNEHTEDVDDYRTLVFSRTKHGADRLVKVLMRVGLRANAIHGNKSQNARQRALESFRDGRNPILVATDVAARGIDIKGVSLVINYDLPEVSESYVHRIGRTARAEASGRAVSFCSEEETGLLRDIEKFTRKTIDPHREHPFHAPAIETRANDKPHSNHGGQRSKPRNNNSRKPYRGRRSNARSYR
jgi:ATP-dependent RNA helicase RhlE